MTKLKLVNPIGSNLETMEERIKLLTDPAKFAGSSENFVGTTNCILDVDHVFREMLTTKILMHKTNFRPYAECVIIPNDPYKDEAPDVHTPEEFLEMVRDFASTVFNEYQTLYVVHLDSRMMHAHILINTISPLTGLKLSQTQYRNSIKRKANDVLEKHGFSTYKFHSSWMLCWDYVEEDAEIDPSFPGSAHICS